MMTQRQMTILASALCAGAIQTGLAATSAYWAFEDQAPGVLATNLLSEVYGDVLVGKAKNTGGSARNPSHDADVPGTNIFDGLYGALLNSDNSASLYFTNAAAYPEQTNSQSGGYVEVTNVTSLLCPTNFTLEFFIKVARPVRYPCVIGKARESGASWCVDIVPDSNQIKLRMDTQPLNQPGNSNGFNQNLVGPSVSDGAWHHMAITYSSSSRLATMFVDYTSRGTMTTTHEAVYTNFSLFMGRGAGSNGAFDGWLDEVRLSDTVLLPTQFLRTDAVPEDAQLYYTFDDAATVPSTATTLVSEAYSPTMNGLTASSAVRPTFSSDIPPATTTRITQGYKGKAVNADNRSSLLFVNAGLPANGSSSGGQVTLPGYLHPSNFTVEAFIKMRGNPGWPLIAGKVRYGGYPTWSLSVSSSQIRCRFDTFPDGGPIDYAHGFNQGFGTGVTVTNGLWHHVAFSYETATKNVKIYVDYVRKVNSTTINPIVYTDGDIVIGNGAGECAFDGWIDEVRITPRLLTPDEFLYTLPRLGTLMALE